MHGIMARAVAAAAATAALSTFGVTGASAPGAATRATQASGHGTLHAAAIPGTQLWAKRYNGPGNGFDGGSSVAVSRSGQTVFVTGISAGATTGEDYATFAYNATTGARLWAARYNGPGNSTDGATSVAVSPSGGMAFVTGYSVGATSREDYATVAYNAATGAQLWAKRYNGPGNGLDVASAVAVSRSGGTVFVTGQSKGAGSGYDYATVAYNATTGARLWAARYNGPGNSTDAAASVAVSPSGESVFVTGVSVGVTSAEDYATIAYNATTGAQLWAKRFNGSGNGVDNASSVAVSPTGDTVFVTGTSRAASLSYDYATIAYNATTGALRWVTRYSGPTARNTASALAVSPTGGTVFVTGASRGRSSDFDYATVAYSATSGAQLWVKRYNGPGNGTDFANAVAVSPTGQTVYVTGSSAGTTSGADYTTIGYNAATGGWQWGTRYNGPGNGTDFASSVAVTPGGGTVFVTGQSKGATSGRDYATIAYSG